MIEEVAYKSIDTFKKKWKVFAVAEELTGKLLRCVSNRIEILYSRVVVRSRGHFN